MTHVERNIRLLIAYDGTQYQGWQRQKDTPTVQGVIEEILTRITQQPVSLVGAGRTDAGVHAWGQVANFRTHSELPLSKIEAALQAILPGDIVIRRVQEAEPDFQARFSARAKIYEYLIGRPSQVTPFTRSYIWFLREPFDIDLIKKGLFLLKGEKDFSSFQSRGSEVSTPIRTLYQAVLLPSPWGGFKMRFKANGFLRHMVRNMVGTLIRVGLKKISLEEFEEIILSRDRSRAGEMAPAHGLYLRKVLY